MPQQGGERGNASSVMPVLGGEQDGPCLLPRASHLPQPCPGLQSRCAHLCSSSLSSSPVSVPSLRVPWQRGCRDGCWGGGSSVQGSERWVWSQPCLGAAGRAPDMVGLGQSWDGEAVRWPGAPQGALPARISPAGRGGLGRAGSAAGGASPLWHGWHLGPSPEQHRGDRTVSLQRCWVPCGAIPALPHRDEQPGSCDPFVRAAELMAGAWPCLEKGELLYGAVTGLPGLRGCSCGSWALEGLQ